MILIANISEVDFVPDGDLDKKVWAACGRVKFRRDAFGTIEFPEIETAASALWTNEYLYLAFWCRYQALHLFAPEERCAEGNELWTRDVVEAFISPEPSISSHYYEFEVSPDNRGLDLEISHEPISTPDTKWTSGFEHAASINCVSRIWTAEMRIPVQSMGVRQVRPSIDWRINLFRADGVGNDYERHLLSWSPLQIANRSFHQPESFGILRFASPGS
jgi:hypothetical protein